MFNHNSVKLTGHEGKINANGGSRHGQVVHKLSFLKTTLVSHNPRARGGGGSLRFEKWKRQTAQRWVPNNLRFKVKQRFVIPILTFLNP